MTDSISVVWFTPKLRGSHFRLPHRINLHIAVFRDPSTLNPPALDFPLIHPQIFTPIS